MYYTFLCILPRHALEAKVGRFLWSRAKFRPTVPQCFPSEPLKNHKQITTEKYSAMFFIRLLGHLGAT